MYLSSISRELEREIMMTKSQAMRDEIALKNMKLDELKSSVQKYRQEHSFAFETWLILCRQWETQCNNAIYNNPLSNFKLFWSEKTTRIISLKRIFEEGNDWKPKYEHVQVECLQGRQKRRWIEYWRQNSRQTSLFLDWCREADGFPRWDILIYKFCWKRH